MDLENQRRIKEIAEGTEDGTIRKDVVVVLGASDLEGALISAETVTLGDPSYSGPLAGVSLRLPVYHILEPKMKEAIPEEVYEETAGMSAMMADTEKIGKEFEELRRTVSNGT